MDEDPTRELNARSFEERVFAEFAAMRVELLALNSRFDGLDARFDGLETRLTTLEEKVDARLRETRPIWEAMQATLDDLSVQFARGVGRLAQDARPCR